MRISRKDKRKDPDEREVVTFLLTIPSDLWRKFVRTVPISRTRHDFILDLIQRRVFEYEKSSGPI